MDMFKAFCLCAIAGIIATAIAFPASAEIVFENENETDEEINVSSVSNVSGFAPEINFTEILDPGLDLNFRFLTSMLELLDLNLRLIDGTLESRVSDYPFLATTMEGTGSGVRAVDSILVVMGSGPQGVNETNVSTDSINESFARINESLESPDSMAEHANSTLGEPNATTPMIFEMFDSIKGMLAIFG
ncbi:hypothetical protein MSMTP_1543 [Methanosarcina sp. MTP4]|uniref:hypothetical protein n=1 Tax=Methanosarcina sp. MTP4 TaxID=1434100 RepID=UPI000615B7D2|nr:hypothetical protein [Methanosarcina sp. MTP4]AKB25012.1 hypothetical protein MSMTP_1543 [Methanosarcina sp. MTP4]